MSDPIVNGPSGDASTEPASRAGRGIGRTSILLGSGTVVSRLLGFIKTIVLAQTLGVVGSAGADAFAIANQLPSNIYVLIAGGVLTATLVPAIVKSALHSDGGRAYINKLMTIALIILLAVTLAATLLAPALIHLYASEWSPEQTALATALAYWCLPQIFFYGLYTLLGEVLNARGSFLPFAWAPALNNVIAIVGVVAFMLLFGVDTAGERAVTDWTPQMITLLGGAATLGVALQAIVLMLAWRRAGIGFRPDFAWRGVGLREAGTMAMWTFGMVIVTQLGGIVEVNVVSLASGEGASVFSMITAWLIFMLPHSIITVSLGTVYFTKMSQDAAAGKRDALGEDTSEALRVIGLLMVWASVGMCVAAFPIARMFATTSDAIASLGILIMVLVVALPTFSALYVVFRVFLALNKAVYLFWLNAFQVGLFVALCFVCAFLPETVLPRQYITLGVAASLSISILSEGLIAYALLRKHLAEMPSQPVVFSTVRTYIAGIIAAAGGVLVVWWLGFFTPESFWQNSMWASVLGGLVALVIITVLYLLVLFVMRAPEVARVQSMLRSRLER